MISIVLRARTERKTLGILASHMIHGKHIVGEGCSMSSDSWQAEVKAGQLQQPKLTVKHTNGLVMHFNDTQLAQEFASAIRDALCNSIAAHFKGATSLDAMTLSLLGQV